MIFNLQKNTNSKLEKFYNDAIERLNDFYMINWNKNKPLILLMDNREDINTLKGRETEDWVVGFTLGSERMLFVLDPDKYEEESNHKYSDEEYSTLIAHELSHLYSRIFYRKFIPVWLIEGVAICSSGQLDTEKYRKPEELKEFLDYFLNGGPRLYAEAGYAVKILIEVGGKEKFLEFYKGLNGVKEPEDLEKHFEEFYGEKLDYDFFNSRL